MVAERRDLGNRNQSAIKTASKSSPVWGLEGDDA
jgi:hypothetical protein